MLTHLYVSGLCQVLGKSITEVSALTKLIVQGGETNRSVLNGRDNTEKITKKLKQQGVMGVDWELREASLGAFKRFSHAKVRWWGKSAPGTAEALLECSRPV